jgi:ElaB/YqjD/DUF883 family membrane-anchored ribosome-binding protein
MVDESNLKAAGNEAAARARDRVGQFVDEVREKAAPILESARDKIVEQAHVMKEKVHEGTENLKKKSLSDLGTDINRYVRNNPGKVVLGAFAVGLIAGAMLRGRNRS